MSALAVTEVPEPDDRVARLVALVVECPRGGSARILMLPGNLDRLFRRRPDLLGTEAARLAESLRDAVVMNA